MKIEEADVSLLLDATGSVKIQQLVIGLFNGFIGKTKGWHNETTPTWKRSPWLISKERITNRGLAELRVAPSDCVSDTDAKRCVYPTLSAIHQPRQCSSVPSTYNDKESWRALQNISELFVMCMSVCSDIRIKTLLQTCANGKKTKMSRVTHHSSLKWAIVHFRKRGEDEKRVHDMHSYGNNITVCNVYGPGKDDTENLKDVKFKNTLIIRSRPSTSRNPVIKANVPIRAYVSHPKLLTELLW